MSLTFESPSQSDDIARDAFLAQMRDPLPLQPTIDAPRLSPGVPLWVADLDAALERSIPSAALWVGWRYFAFDETDAMAADVVAHGVQPVASRVFGGSAVRATMDALAQAEDLAGEGSVARILIVPALFFTGIWLPGEAARCIEVGDEGAGIDWDAGELFEQMKGQAEARVRAARRTVRRSLRRRSPRR